MRSRTFTRPLLTSAGLTVLLRVCVRACVYVCVCTCVYVCMWCVCVWCVCVCVRARARVCDYVVKQECSCFGLVENPGCLFQNLKPRGAWRGDASAQVAVTLHGRISSEHPMVPALPPFLLQFPRKPFLSWGLTQKPGITGQSQQ